MFPHHMVIYFDAVVLLGADLSAGTLHSHSKIVSTMCRISSDQGKYKASSTCGERKGG